MIPYTGNKCSHCGEESSQQGHYFSMGPDPCPNGPIHPSADGRVWGFRCRPGHQCLTGVPKSITSHIAGLGVDDEEE